MKFPLLATAALALVAAAQARQPEPAEPAAEEAPPARAQTADGAAEKEDVEWDVNAPPLETRDVAIDVSEGTWMSLDVSPDGKTIAFDLLGDVYTMPIDGGDARNIASGLAYEGQPRYSPDGAHIAFTSDRGGGDNIWIMKSDGSDKRQLTDENFRLLNNATWSPDGRFIAAKKHFTTERSLGTGEIWLYHLGGGDGITLVERPNEDHQKELGEPVFAPDGKSIYFTRNVSPGGTFIYAQDSNQSLFEIERYDLETGERETVVSGAGGAVRPAPSPDGKSIAFVRRVRGASALFVKDLASGAERVIYDALDRDMQETWGVYGLYPNMDWTPDSASIVFWAGGKIWRVDVAEAKATQIPFSISDTRAVIDPPRPRIDVAPDTFKTRMPRFAAVSPDGGEVVFESLGKLYIKALPDGAPRRLTDDQSTDRELFPSWSRDGSRIVFVSWNDADLGAIRSVSSEGAQLRALTPEPGHYRRPRFSPDGETVVFEKRAGGYLTSGEWSQRTGIFRMPSNGDAEMTRVTKSGYAPHFADEDDRIYLTRSGDGEQMLVSVDLNGEAERLHASGPLVTEYQVAPDGAHFAFRENYSAYVMPMPPGPQKVAAGRSASAAPAVKASGDGATYLHWSAGGETLNWSLGPDLYAAEVADMIPSMPDAPAEGDDEGAQDSAQDGAQEGYAPPKAGVSLAREVEAARPSGFLAITGARIVTMADENGGVVENGTIVIEANRIARVGPAGVIEIPDDAKVVDASGKTVIPGLIDAHAHGPQGVGDLIPQQNWSAIAHLALGVTTIFDPSSTATEIFAAAEMQRAGELLAPRTFSTGEIVYGAKSPSRYAVVDSLDDAREHVRRLKKQGAHGIKNYNQPRREQRQQVVAAAKEEDILVAPEGGSLFQMDISLIADGNTTMEHNLPQAKLYEDVLSFFAATKVAYTPTLVVTYGGLAGDPYWRYKTDVWTHPILSAHVPPHILQPASVRRTKAPEEDFADQYAAAGAKALAERGVPVSIGAHGQQEGLAAHWEMWSFARGGMSPLEALRAATTAPAEALGFDRDIGTLAPGKLADLVILNENPLTDIRNSDKVDRVMLNGRLYDAATMNEVVTGDAKRAPYYWE